MVQYLWLHGDLSRLLFRQGWGGAGRGGGGRGGGGEGGGREKKEFQWVSFLLAKKVRISPGVRSNLDNRGGGKRLVSSTKCWLGHQVAPKVEREGMKHFFFTPHTSQGWVIGQG